MVWIGQVRQEAGISAVSCGIWSRCGLVPKVINLLGISPFKNPGAV